MILFAVWGIFCAIIGALIVYAYYAEKDIHYMLTHDNEIDIETEDEQEGSERNSV